MHQTVTVLELHAFPKRLLECMHRMDCCGIDLWKKECSRQKLLDLNAYPKEGIGMYAPNGRSRERISVFDCAVQTKVNFVSEQSCRKDSESLIVPFAKGDR